MNFILKLRVTHPVFDYIETEVLVKVYSTIMYLSNLSHLGFFKSGWLPDFRSWLCLLCYFLHIGFNVPSSRLVWCWVGRRHFGWYKCWKSEQTTGVFVHRKVCFYVMLIVFVSALSLSINSFGLRIKTRLLTNSLHLPNYLNVWSNVKI